MVVSRCRHGFFPLATLSRVGETGISEMTTEAGTAVHRAREREPVCGRFRSSGFLENWGARKGDWRHPGSHWEQMMWWELHLCLIAWLFPGATAGCFGLPRLCSQLLHPMLLLPSHCSGDLATSWLHRTPGDSSQIPPLWLLCEHSSRFHIFLSGSTVQVSALSVPGLITEIISQASLLILSPPFSSGNNTQNLDTHLGKILICMHQKLTLDNHIKKRDLLQGSWTIQRTPQKAMGQYLDSRQAQGKLSHRHNDCQNHTQGLSDGTPEATRAPPGGPPALQPRQRWPCLQGLNSTAAAPATQPYWHWGKPGEGWLACHAHRKWVSEVSAFTIGSRCYKTESNTEKRQVRCSSGQLLNWS